MIRVLCTLLLLGFHYGHSKELPSIFEVEGSINRTISEVERLINENPSLPRLSRHQIVDILYNITSKDLESYEDKTTIENARKMYQRALMVVLPYKARESSESLKDLYTKPPIVQIISDSASGERFQMVLDDRSRESSASYEIVSSETESPIDNFVVTNPAEKTSYKTILPKNHREIYSDVRSTEAINESLSPGSAPVRFSFNLDNLQKNSYTTERTIMINDPIFQSTTTDNAKVQNINVVLGSLGNDKDESSEELTIDLTRPSVTTTKSNQNVLSSDQWRYHPPPPQKTVEKYSQTSSLVPTTIKMSLEDGITSRTTTEQEAESLIDIQNDERPSPVYVTPLTSTSTSQKPKYTSTFALNSGGFRAATTTSTEKTSTEPMREEVMDLLASIGLRPDNKTNVEEVFNKNKEMLENESRVPDTQGLIHTTTVGLSDSPSIAEQNTFETGAFDLKKGMQNLTPDVQLLFQRFGLQTSIDKLPTVSATTQTSTNSYTNFKPLPTSSVKDQDMKEFLARFGLGLNDNRQRKAMKTVTEPPSVIEAVPFNMRTVLENIGLISNSHRNVKNMANANNDMQETESTKYHVFKPHETIFKDETQKSKINDLLDTVKLVQEGKADAKDVQKVASDLLKTTKTLSNGPDPLSLEEIIRVYNEDLKNEVKRQQDDAGRQTSTESSVDSNAGSTETVEGTTATGSTITTASTDSAKATNETTQAVTEAVTTTTTTTTISPNLVDLENSFGGTTRAPDPVLPPKRKSGLYFLVDWNSFLEVGEENNEKINLRFQPKVGDRTRFLPVTVP